MRRQLLYVVMLLVGFDAQAADLAVEQPWARATPGRAPTGAAYFSLTNRGAEADRLVGAATSAAARAELHGHRRPPSHAASGQAGGHAGHVMEMRPVAEIAIKPGESVVLKPDALHVMLIGLKAPLKEGGSFPLTLRFARAGEIQVEVRVGKAGAMGPPR